MTRMVKQVTAMGVAGAVLALLGAAVAEALDTADGTVDFMSVGSSTDAAGLADGIWSRYLVALLAGAVVGAATGAVLAAAGYRLQGRGDGRFGRSVGAAFVGIVVGMAPLLVLIGLSFGGAFDDGGALDAGTRADWGSVISDYILAIYAASAVAAYGLALAAQWMALRMVGDTRTRATVTATAILLPVGAIVATAAGVGVAATMGFAVVDSVWVAVVVPVVLVLLAFLAGARAIALRRLRSVAT